MRLEFTSASHGRHDDKLTRTSSKTKTALDPQQLRDASVKEKAGCIMSTSKSTEEMLEQAARDGSMDIAEWPRVLENVLNRLQHIVHNDFPLPRITQSSSSFASSTSSFSSSAPAAVAPVAAASPPAALSSQASDSSTAASSSQQSSQSDDATDGAQPLSQPPINTNKENAPPVRPPVPSFSATSNANAPSASSVQQAPLPDSPLLPDLLHSYQSSTNILRNTFGKSPPHTLQRLAELVLAPRRHYKYLPSFLSALDRIVSVTSPATDFPLPQLSVSGSVNFLANGDGTNGTVERGGLGSDESLGGALLTPISWIKKRDDEAMAAAANVETNGAQLLRTEDEATIDGPRGAGRIETVSVTTNGPNRGQSPVLIGDGEGSEASQAYTQELRSQGAVTQGELLRQEQEAGVVPAGQETPRNPLLQSGGAAAVGRDPSVASGDAGEASALATDRVVEERPHARGPEVVGMEDTGPQAPAVAGYRSLDMEAAAGKKESQHSASPHAEEGRQTQPTTSIVDKKEEDPMTVEGNSGGAAQTAAEADAAELGEKRKRDSEEQEKDGVKKQSKKDGVAEQETDNDKEMTDVVD